MTNEEVTALKGAKVITVIDNEIYFDNGSVIEFNPNDTYVYLPKEEAE